MNLGIVILAVLVVAFIGVLPTWRYSRNWGYAPVGSIGAVLAIFLLLWVLGVF